MTRRRPVPALVAALLVAVVLGACSDDGPDDGPADRAVPTTTSSPSSPSSPSSADDPATALVETGLQQLTAGDARTARTTFENALTLDPGNLYALYNLGLIAQRRGDDATAAQYYDEALAVDGDYPPALYNRAIITEADDLEAATATYRRVIEVDPEFAAAYVRLGFALIHLGNRAEGQDLLQQGIDLDPGLADEERPRYP